MRTVHTGRVLRLKLPNEIPGLILPEPQHTEPDLEQMDFFNVSENRFLILKRENYRCFYMLRPLDRQNFVVEHIVSRPNGDNSYRNVVAASRQANDMKGSISAEDFLRRLYRENYLNEEEFRDRMEHLTLLKAGEFKPPMA